MEQTRLITIGIIADDLTSATDGAAPFMAKNYSPFITRSIGEQPPMELIAIDTNSRALTSLEAQKITTKAVNALCRQSIIFKTIDSTLRGNIKEEITAAFHASNRNRLIVAPAFPEAGRLTINGIQTVHGVRVCDSEYGRDPVHPARTSQIAQLIDASLGRPVVLRQDCSNGEFSLAQNAPVLIIDADSQEMLNRQVARICNPEDVLWVGSPGLAIALAERVNNLSIDKPTPIHAVERVLIVAGSTNKVTHSQCDALAANDIPVISVDEQLVSNPEILCLRAPIHLQSEHRNLLAKIASQAAAMINHNQYDAIIATGGETMAAILTILEIESFVLIGEFEAGFPMGRVQMPNGTSLIIAMKAGGFGSSLTLLNAISALTSGKVILNERA